MKTIERPWPEQDRATVALERIAAALEKIVAVQEANERRQQAEIQRLWLDSPPL